jgi:hypothetical protein
MELGELLDELDCPDRSRPELLHQLIYCLVGDEATGNDRVDVVGLGQDWGIGARECEAAYERLSACRVEEFAAVLTTLIELRSPLTIFEH